HSRDGIDWTIFDFNKVYSGFYKTCAFIKVEATPIKLLLLGKPAMDYPFCSSLQKETFGPNVLWITPMMKEFMSH
ncbi:MAG TPA: hypothetical protein PKJ43_06490, partial [Prolixibacteraceae bacterium]|nr:hypothetical protein [Prolixibacteraceae bacterium]